MADSNEANVSNNKDVDSAAKTLEKISLDQKKKVDYRGILFVLFWSVIYITCFVMKLYLYDS